MIILKKLNQEYLKYNYKIISKIAKDIYLISLDESDYILKKINVPINYNVLNQQHKYIKYLKQNGVNTADIKFCYKNNNSLYELQEYIKPDKKTINITELIKLIAKYHFISSKYNGLLSKKKCYKHKFKCANFELNNLLLGFNEKYYYYPRQNVVDNISLISNNNRENLDELLKIYDECYHYFISNYITDDCIAHNDITSNNVIVRDNELYLIDFDLAVKSSIYVDFIDCVIKRYKTIPEIDASLNIINKNIIRYTKIYNKYNYAAKINHVGVLCIFILKIISFNFYVLLNKKNTKKFNDDLPNLLNLIKRIYNLYMEVK